ncbi:alpha-glucan family phosphorylase [Pedobacter sp. SYSU D00535]|uniref:alpha-glucan family phosphorylase n=1 Tax=Pedobacter sp. SYSU D00535 TaxID=2810308 RepID=UPI001A97CF3B|nr:alpha-glucan family phosphorylase [Pedobacter sp. SYSU D00535]
MIDIKNVFSYPIDERYTKRVAYFSMEFAVDQALKIYSGGLGFLAGSHLRSAYELKQNLIGIGMLWKYGYYDQERDTNANMKSSYVEKNYSFLEDTGIVFTVPVHNSPVHVKAFLLRPEVFGSAPLFLLSTDLPENDSLARTITHRLYDSNEQTRIAQSIILGTGGAMLLDILNYDTEVYHMNEGHSLSLNFYLYSKFRSLEEVKKRVVFTTHTPEAAGNEEHSFGILKDMGFFYHLQEHEVRHLLGIDSWNLNYTLAALKFARRANAVSAMHGDVSRDMWNGNSGICEIISITNAQNKTYWADPVLDRAIAADDDTVILERKRELKRMLFKEVANQTGKLFDENVLTVVWARRFAAYKRADLLMYNWGRFLSLINNAKYPIQVIWAGKPYPEDYGAIGLYNHIINRVKPIRNCAVLTGYELGLSGLLKKGSDVWLNNPRLYREASGTSGMTAAMNGSINLSIPDGWIPEFAKDKENLFLIPTANQELYQEEKDKEEAMNLVDILEKEVLPMYYVNQSGWLSMLKRAARDVSPAFEAGRMAEEYYQKMYNY